MDRSKQMLGLAEMLVSAEMIRLEDEQAKTAMPTGEHVVIYLGYSVAMEIARILRDEVESRQQTQAFMRSIQALLDMARM